MSAALDEALLALPEDAAEALARAHARALTTAHRSGLRRWQCPVCFVAVVRRTPPTRWLIVEPFTRVAACAVCRPEIQTRTA